MSFFLSESAQSNNDINQARVSDHISPMLTMKNNTSSVQRENSVELNNILLNFFAALKASEALEADGLLPILIVGPIRSTQSNISINISISMTLSEIIGCWVAILQHI